MRCLKTPSFSPRTPKTPRKCRFWWVPGPHSRSSSFGVQNLPVFGEKGVWREKNHDFAASGCPGPVFAQKGGEKSISRSSGEPGHSRDSANSWTTVLGAKKGGFGELFPLFEALFALISSKSSLRTPFWGLRGRNTLLRGFGGKRRSQSSESPVWG